MTFWYLLLAAAALIALSACVYVTRRIHRFTPITRLGERHALLSWLVSLCPLAAPALFYIINVYSAAIVLMHMALFLLISDGVCRVIEAARKKKLRRDLAGVIALGLAAVYLAAGWYQAHHVWVTRYEFETDKSLGGDIRVVEVADSHLGITLDGEDFAREMEKVRSAKPDVVVICGDFVDDDTEKEDMLTACRALGQLDAPYGVYFIYGNHDKGYFRYRNFTSRELRDALAENGVVILEDETADVDGRFLLIGRQDRSTPDRADMMALTEGLDPEKYQIVLDHQPNDYAAEAEADVDLVLSGHTHGGHIFPAGLIGLAMGSNDRVYGTEERDGTRFVVTSGISGWAIPFKTGTFSEIVVIDIRERD